MPAWEGERFQTNMGWEGEGPWWYTAIPEPHLTSELSRASNPKSETFSGLQIDSVTFQPCLEETEASQDRLFSLAIPGVGTLTGVFDGHGGHEAVDLAISTLPGMIADALTTSARSVDDLSKALANAIHDVDQTIQDGITNLFPDGAEGLAKMSDDEVNAIVGVNHDKLLLAMRGTTALIALVDEKKENLWIANLGDCLAVMGSQSPEGAWKTEVLTTSHNGGVASEAERIKGEHPGEEECLTRSRVLGAIAVTRALGDSVFKLPAIYTSRVFLSPNAPAFRTHTPIKEVVLPRILTPPYLNAEADVTHYSLSSNAEIKKRVLILCSDGLPTLALQMGEAQWRIPGISAAQKEAALVRLEKEAAEGWVRSVGAKLDSTSARDKSEQNLALTILRSALGSDDGIGKKEEDPALLARWLTVEIQERWMDDITIQTLHL